MSEQGATLEGNDLMDSGLSVRFREAQVMTKICDLEITAEVEEVFLNAVKNHYWYQMYIDELPIWGMVGEFMVAESEVRFCTQAHKTHTQNTHTGWTSERGRGRAGVFVHTQGLQHCIQRRSDHRSQPHQRKPKAYSRWTKTRYDFLCELAGQLFVFVCACV